MTHTEPPPYETNYEGLFGLLSKYIPLLDASVPGGWKLAYRSYSMTSWHHVASDVVVIVGKSTDGWNVYVRDPNTGYKFQTLPKKASRWNAFSAAQDFMAGEPLMLVDERPYDGLVTLEKLSEGEPA